MTPQNNGILNEIDAIEQRLTELEYEQVSLIQKRDDLIQKCESHQDSKPNISLTLPVNKKIDLFKKLFKGRPDVFAKQWQNATGRSGYSFACQNEWIKGICNKPRIKCNECPNRAYIALNDQVLYDHNAEIGVIGGGKKKPSGQIDIAIYQSLINKKDNTIDPLIQDYGQIIIDECHHISVPRFEMVLNEVRAKFVLGLTAIPDRQDGHQKIIFMLAGPIRHKVKTNHSEKFEQQVVVTQLSNQPPPHLLSSEERPRISDAYHWLMENDVRTQKIIDDVIAQIAEGKHPLVLTERREHAENINQILLEKEICSVILRGAMRANEQLADAQVIVATGKYIDEGFDLPRLDTLFLAMPIAWKGSLAQYAGRIPPCVRIVVELI